MFEILNPVIRWGAVLVLIAVGITCFNSVCWWDVDVDQDE